MHTQEELEQANARLRALALAPVLQSMGFQISTVANSPDEGLYTHTFTVPDRPFTAREREWFAVDWLAGAEQPTGESRTATPE